MKNSLNDYKYIEDVDDFRVSPRRLGKINRMLEAPEKGGAGRARRVPLL